MRWSMRRECSSSFGSGLGIVETEIPAAERQSPMRDFTLSIDFEVAVCLPAVEMIPIERISLHSWDLQGLADFVNTRSNQTFLIWSHCLRYAATFHSFTVPKKSPGSGKKYPLSYERVCARPESADDWLTREFAPDQVGMGGGA